MNGKTWLAERFERNRAHLRAVAYRMMGSLGDADDAVQEAWLRLSRADTSGIENLEGWLTTVVARVCLDMLRSRKARRQEDADTRLTEVAAEKGSDPEQEAALAESVGIALLVVLERLAPAERIAFVLHDVFAMSFEEIAPIVERSPVAARQLASRARRRVQGTSEISQANVSQQREVVDAFLTALRAGDFGALLAVLDPEIVRRADRAAVPTGAVVEIRGATEVAKEALTHAGRARFARAALVNGSVGIVVAPHGRLFMAIRCAVKEGRIAEMEVIADPARLENLEIAVLDEHRV
jgi:RNA polymerase sigma factor (sigma-70 family)